MTAFAELVGAHFGARVCVMGGASSLADHLNAVHADVFIAANAHGAHRAQYMVAMDPEVGDTGVPMLGHLRAHSAAPIISRHPWADYLLTDWPGHPRTSVLTGMVAVWAAAMMGAREIMLAGIDGYGGVEEAMRSAHQVAERITTPVRVIGGGPLAIVWPERA